MNKISLFLFVIVLGAQPPLKAQFLFGLQGGLNVAMLTNTSSFSTTTRPEWHAGLMFDIGFGKHFSFMPAILYSKRGYKYDYTTSYSTQPATDTIITTTAIADVNANLGYLDVPVLLNIYFGDHKGFMLNAGGQFSFLITDNSTVKTSTSISVNGGQPTNPTDPETSNEVKFNKGDVALIAGIGYKFEKLLMLYLRASTGFGKVQEDNSFIQSNDAGRNLTFEAGVALTFGSK